MHKIKQKNNKINNYKMTTTDQLIKDVPDNPNILEEFSDLRSQQLGIFSIINN